MRARRLGQARQLQGLKLRPGMQSPALLMQRRNKC